MRRACQMKGVSGAVGRIRATSGRPLPSPPGRTGARGEAPVFNTDVEPVRQALIPLEEPPGTTAPAKLPCGADRPRCLARIMQPQRKPGMTDSTAGCRRVSDWRPWARHVEPQIAFARGGKRTVTVVLAKVYCAGLSCHSLSEMRLIKSLKSMNCRRAKNDFDPNRTKPLRC